MTSVVGVLTFPTSHHQLATIGELVKLGITLVLTTMKPVGQQT